MERSNGAHELTNFQGDIDMDEGGGGTQNGSNKPHSLEAGEVGLLILSDPVCFESIIYLSIKWVRCFLWYIP